MRLINFEELTQDVQDTFNKEHLEKITVEAIPISWLTSKGMMKVDNDTRVELFKLISEWRKENE